jgi:DNA repair photolyase
MDVTEITTKSALTRSRIAGVEYVINPYLGCAHGCKYCYAGFMAKWSKHHAGSPWGSFVEVKVNIAAVLERELRSRRKTGAVMLSSVCDPYQPLEARYRLTRQCLSLLVEYGWEIDILTRSPLVTRDLDILQKADKARVGISIPTDDEHVRKCLEPHSPPIYRRLDGLKQLHDAGIKTWVFIAPILPMSPAKLCEAIRPNVDYVLIDRLNYRRRMEQVFRKKGWSHALSDAYAAETEARLLDLLKDKARLV